MPASAVDSSSTSAAPAVGAPPAVRVTFVVVAVLLLAGLVGLKLREYVRFLDFSSQAVMDPLPLQRPAPGFSLPPGPGGAPVQLERLRGQHVLVHFWATWCPPCRDELRSLEYLTRALRGRVQVVAITVDDDWGEVERFFGGRGPSFALAWDRQRQVADAYGTQKFPETFLVDPQGQVIAKFVGARDWNSRAAHRYFDELSGR